MLLLTGGTGFIGRALTRQLVDTGHDVRVLLRPSPKSPRLPIGVPVEVAVSSLSDVRGLRAAMQGIEAIYHLVGGEGEGGAANLQAVDIEGTRNLCAAAADAKIARIFYISHLGADRASGYPVLKAKGIAEEYIRKSGVPFTILRGSILFGPEDNFTTGLAMLLAIAPGLLPLPGGGKSLVQPFWVEDLATCLVWALDEQSTVNQTYDVGGSEYFSMKEVADIVMEVTHQPRLIFPINTPTLRVLTVMFETAFPRFPASVFWLDYMAMSRTCDVGTVPEVFGLMPARFASRLDHLRGQHWTLELLKRIVKRN